MRQQFSISTLQSARSISNTIRLTLLHCRWTTKGSSETSVSTKLHDVTFYKTVTFIFREMILKRKIVWSGKLSRYSGSLLDGRSGDRIPVGTRFSVPVQTFPGAPPASYTMGTGSFPGVKRLGCDADPTPHLAARLTLWRRNFLLNFSTSCI